MSAPVLLPVGPLVCAVEERGGLTALLPVTHPTALLSLRQVRAFRRNYMRRRTVGTVTVEWVDRFCIQVLGVLPELIYGHIWWDSVAPEPEDVAA